MPAHIKIGLSVAVALAALGGFLYMRHLGQTGPQWALAFLGPFMVVSLWIFPEVMRTRGEGRVPRHKLGEAPRS